MRVAAPRSISWQLAIFLALPGKTERGASLLLGFPAKRAYRDVRQECCDFNTDVALESSKRLNCLY
jgi:hypothetical protein